ncbi:SP_0009 family protein [Streptococcus sp. DD10]|nr:SP_0009 family protein [Streptococcus sp. DD10]
MENLLTTIEQFLAYSDEKLKELAVKNQELKLTERSQSEHA